MTVDMMNTAVELEREITPGRLDSDVEELALRPQALDEFIGQP